MSSTAQPAVTARCAAPGQWPAEAASSARAAAPNGVHPTMSAISSGMASTGSHTPAVNMAGNSAAEPAAVAIFAVRERALSSAPRAREAARASSSARRWPSGCPGRATPKASRPTARVRSAETREAAPSTVICAASRADGRTGVVDIRRRMPVSR